MNNELRYWLALNCLPAVGAVRISDWLEKVGNVASLFTADRQILAKYGLTSSAIEALQAPDWTRVDKELGWVSAASNHHLITLNDPHYPLLLKQIHSPPAVLYVKGNLALLMESQLAIVGSRNPTASGAETAYEFACCLSKAGLVITSGLALGIDAAGHRGALAATGKTVAVLGTGIDQVYPAKNNALGQAILAQGGTLISEFPLGSAPKPAHFPQRNRIISGLSLGTLVVEAALQSGSLITAKYALEQGREVFAIPGSIHNPMVRGCHRLLREGAKLVETVEDVLEELGSLANMKRECTGPVIEANLEKKYAELLKYVDYAPTPMDVLVKRSRLNVAEVASMVLVLELQGYVKASALGYYKK